MALEDWKTFYARVDGLPEEEGQQELQAVHDMVLSTMKQKGAIPDALPKSLFKKIDAAYLRHLGGKAIDYFGCDQESGLLEKYEDTFKNYFDEVCDALSEKAASFQKDATDSIDLTLINDQLVNKWAWVLKGLFNCEHWSTHTRIPLLTQSVLKDFDYMLDKITTALAAVR
jgi:hypothetical protein